MKLRLLALLALTLCCVGLAAFFGISSSRPALRLGSSVDDLDRYVAQEVSRDRRAGPVFFRRTFASGPSDGSGRLSVLTEYGVRSHHWFGGRYIDVVTYQGKLTSVSKQKWVWSWDF
jgi:hypothetical protein